MLITQNSLRTIGWKARKETVHLSLKSILIYQQTKVLLTPFGNSLYYGTVLFYLLLVVTHRTLFSFTSLLYYRLIHTELTYQARIPTTSRPSPTKLGTRAPRSLPSTVSEELTSIRIGASN